MTKILVADDSATILKVVELTFMDMPGIELAIHGDGDSACVAIARLRPDVVIADVHMPGRSGFEVARYAKTLLPERPVLILVGTFEPFDEGLFEASGADAVIEKPFDSHELTRAVLSLLRGDKPPSPYYFFSSRRILTRSTPARPTAPRLELRVFLCHASQDKAAVRRLAEKLRTAGVAPWLDEEKLLPGQQWQLEVTRALRDSQAVLVCLSKQSVTKTGYVQKEIVFALDLLEQQPEGSIFLIPLQLEDCEVPERLSHLQLGRLHQPDGFTRLLAALKERGRALGIGLP